MLSAGTGLPTTPAVAPAVVAVPPPDPDPAAGAGFRVQLARLSASVALAATVRTAVPSTRPRRLVPLNGAPLLVVSPVRVHTPASR